jgi:conjugal transfer/type IV secretion protein DotA/TraY
MATEIPATAEVLLKTDASKQFLDTLLGQGWDAWGQGLGGTQAAELMLQLFSTFNIVALAVISALFIWVLAVAVAGTAHEGTPFGKRYNSLWMPLRFVGAMGALAPIFKGLSFFQVAILACIGLSINLGNFVWSLGTDYFVEHGGQMTVQAPDQNVTQYSAIVNGSLQSLSMQYYMNERRGLNVQPGGEWKYSGNWIRSGGAYKFTFNGNAGSITVECVDENDALCRGKVNAVGTAISTLSGTARYFRHYGRSRCHR